MKPKFTVLASAILLLTIIAIPTFSIAQVTQQWASRYNGPGSYADYGRSIAVDGSGNVYVTGYSVNSGSISDYATIKYNSAGVQQWASKYNGPGNGNDQAHSITVDGSGNVYVTGQSDGSGTGSDYATIKYDASGIEQWAVRYNGPGNGIDAPTSIAVDASGNVYVTGNSFGSGTDDDYATIKYDATGAQLWVVRYNGLQNAQDGASSLAVDLSGNVYVTGFSVVSITSSDYTTIKYNSSGVQQWAAFYNGPGNYLDNATSLALDDSGYVYVTGRSKGSSLDDDYATIKYDASGVEQWAARYTGPGNGGDAAYALAVDGSGNVYVTGRSTGSGTGYDYATVKYNSSGVQQWAKRYNGLSNNIDEANSIAVDGSGNVYVTGRSAGSGTNNDYATIKYDATGVEQWVSKYYGPGNGSDFPFSLAVDGSGNVYVTGESFGGNTLSDYGTIKYDSTGNQLWAASYDQTGPGNSNDNSSSIAVDDMGNVYVTGGSWGGATGYDYATIKYNSLGDTIWLARYNGPGNDLDIATSLAVDDSGNVYVTGYSTGSASGYDYATIKYDSNGVQQWVKRYNGSGNSSDFASSLVTDGLGNVYVTGRTRGGPGTNDDYATIKYNSAGIQQWVKLYNGPGNDEDAAWAIAVDGSGNVYVTGGSSPIGTYLRDYATVKYNSSGAQQWVKRYNGPGNLDDFATSLAVDTSGNVYVSGFSAGSGTNNDYATIKYNSMGDTLWITRYNGPGNGIDEANSLALDGLGNVYVTGKSAGSGTDNDYATIKYNSTGVEQWVSRYNGPGNGSDGASQLALDGTGNVYVTGGSIGSGTGNDFATIKYDSAGVEQWAARYNGPGNGSDGASKLTIDGTGNVYVTGGSLGSGTANDYATIKYSQLPVGIETVTAAFSSMQLFPNPATTSVTIKFPSDKAGATEPAELQVVNFFGQIVYSAKVNEAQTQVDVSSFAAGMYVIKWSSGKNFETKTFSVIK